MSGRQPTPLETEVNHVTAKTRAIIDSYVDWRKHIVYNNYSTTYGELLDFVNFRMETADSCLLLIENRKIADALGLCRSLLENYMLLMLMCRGSKYFQLQDLSDLSEAQFKERLAKQQEALKEQQATGKTDCIAVEKYPRAKRHLMYIFEGLRDENIPGYTIPVHFFNFKEFSPETMRLRDEDYFQYYEPEADTKKAMKQHRQNATFNYRHYLSYDALLQCLKLNDIVDNATLAKIEAHYTFLGRFLHPTHEAARGLHNRSNAHNGETAVGMNQTYTETAVLLAALYTCFIITGIAEEIAGLFENAPTEYMKDAGTAGVRAVTASIPTDHSYFWFLFNDPPMYDRFNYCVYHATDDELKEWVSYEKVPLERVPFEQNIYGHLKDTLTGWSNQRCGSYEPKLASHE